MGFLMPASKDFIKSTFEDLSKYFLDLGFSKEHAYQESVKATAEKCHTEEKEVIDSINIKVWMETKKEEPKKKELKTPLDQKILRKAAKRFDPEDFSGDNPYAGRRHGRREEHVLGGENESKRRTTMKRGFN